MDEIGYTIGGQLVLFKIGPDGPDECKGGMSTLLETLAKRRREGLTGRPIPRCLQYSRHIASDEDYTIVRASLLVDGETDIAIPVGI